MPNLLGTAPNQVPTNADLGKLAFMDVVDTVTNNPYLDTAISDTKPSLLLDFANSKTLDPRITYTRASTATYYDGKTTAVAEQNLLTSSQEFNTNWGKDNTSVTLNSTVAPDGTSTAVSVVANTVNNYHSLFSSASTVSGLVYTFSVYAKAGTYTKLSIADSTSARWSARYDLVAGTVLATTGTNYVSSSITLVGNGWYRCTLSITANATYSPFALIGYPDTGATLTGYGASYIGDSTSGIYLWGAQAEQRSAVSSYTPTTSSPITNYIPALQTAAAGVPRFDHDPVTGESKGFLIEEQRTNLLTYSTDFSNAAWTKVNATISADTIVAPDGTLSGDKIVESTGTVTPYAYNTLVSVTSGTVYATSVYVKSGSTRYLQVTGTAGAFGGTACVNFDLSSGTVVYTAGGATGTITSVGNGWYRCVTNLTATATTTGNAVVALVNSATSGRLVSYTGDGYSGLYIWGAQLEAGSFATSYIPTTSAQVTRSADAASMTGANFSSWYRADEGSFYSEFNVPATSAHIATSGIGRFLYVINMGGASFGAARIFDGTNTAATSSPFLLGSNAKSATAYSSSGLAATANGTSVVTSAYDGSISDGVLYIGSLFNSSTERANGTIKKLAYYPKRLSNDELMEMTQ